ncbi:VCBS repeat-containing protein [Belliella marina]|uniref:VCBS repeat-containing protein n=1 Tax=Belliella marina TaxID=1644146 RepID=A0ABW4VQA3_9BACT
MGKFRTLIILAGSLLVLACGKEEDSSLVLLEELSPELTGVNFENTIIEDDELNILTYEYLYNGGGVAASDLNNDGLPDLIFTGNRVGNKVYLNLGDYRFEDITESSGLGGREGFKTGVTVADVNGDGFLDIYYCYSGPGSDQDRRNELYINNGDLTFTESAAEYGLDAVGTFSTMAAFFDYDGDGDLDMFLLNHAKTFFNPTFNTTKLRASRHPQYGNRLYRNDGGVFTDVSIESGINGSGLNFGLGLFVSDVNNDGKPDIYVTNDYNEQDFFYLNNGDGTFDEVLQKSFGHISKYSMGGDFADYNNDGLVDLLTLDMLPEDNYRQKLLKGPDAYNTYNLFLDSGYHHQNMRNMLQLNRGFDESGIPYFSEIGQLAGVSNTDWSWAGLFVDLDNDGWKDMVITNGYLRDFTNMDFLNFTYADAAKEAQQRGEKPDLVKLVNQIPSSKISNYIFSNNKDLTFSDKTKAWGFDQPAVSNGAVYVDLNNSGAMDLVVNNINQPASIYRNNVKSILSHNHLKIKLVGLGQNSFAIGAKVEVYHGKSYQMQELFPVRGYQSTTDHILHFGIGTEDKVDSLKIYWPNGLVSDILNPKVNTLSEYSMEDAIPGEGKALQIAADEKILRLDVPSRIDFQHSENTYVDFKYERLLPAQLSRLGPKMAVGDLNNDGIDDVFIGGASGQAGRLYMGMQNGGFEASLSQPWVSHKVSEDLGVLFFDANGDGLDDIYICSGGNEYSEGFFTYQDRLYINDENAGFVHQPNALPEMLTSSSVVEAYDFDGDGDLDLFIGGRLVPGKYGESPRSYLLRNDTDGNHVKFTDVTPEILQFPGMVTGGLWTDLDKDGKKELVIVGEWMPIMVFEEVGGDFVESSAKYGLGNKYGMWTGIFEIGEDKDGFPRILVGNLGKNAQFKASDDKPLNLYVGDFDGNGSMDPVITQYIGDGSYPIASKDELIEQMPGLKRKFLSYKSYANASITDIVDVGKLKDAKHLHVNCLESVMLRKTEKGDYQTTSLPLGAQFSPIYGVEKYPGRDFWILAGNFIPNRVEWGPYDASKGNILQINESSEMTILNKNISELDLSGDIRDIRIVKLHDGSHVLLVAVNNKPVKVYKLPIDTSKP